MPRMEGCVWKKGRLYSCHSEKKINYTKGRGWKRSTRRVYILRRYLEKVIIWPRLLKRWIALSSGQITIQRIAQLVSLILVHWIVIYSVDSAIQRLNNRGQMNIRETNCTILWIEIYPVNSVIHRSDNWGQVSVAVLPNPNIFIMQDFSKHSLLDVLLPFIRKFCKNTALLRD